MTSSEVPARLPILRPFADNGTKDVIPDETGDFMNITQGFPSVYGVPASSGGKYVSRLDMNSIGFMATNDLFYHKCGGLNTFDAEFASKVGGYPQGAILQYLNGKYLYNVISLHDNNTFNFVAENSINNIDWAYCNQDVAPTEKILVLESNQYINAPADADSVQETLLGVFKAPKTGPVIFEGSITPSVYVAMNWGNVLGVGIFVKDLGESYTSIPSLTLSTINTWTAVSLSHGDLNTSIGDIIATFGHYYVVKALAAHGATGYPYADLNNGQTPFRIMSGAGNSTKIYIA